MLIHHDSQTNQQLRDHLGYWHRLCYLHQQRDSVDHLPCWHVLLWIMRLRRNSCFYPQKKYGNWWYNFRSSQFLKMFEPNFLNCRYILKRCLRMLSFVSTNQTQMKTKNVIGITYGVHDMKHIVWKNLWGSANSLLLLIVCDSPCVLHIHSEFVNCQNRP